MLVRQPPEMSDVDSEWLTRGRRTGSDQGPGTTVIKVFALLSLADCQIDV